MREPLVLRSGFVKDSFMRKSIEKLSEQIRNQPNLDQGEKEELLSLISGIETEVGSGPDAEDAHPVREVVDLTMESVEGQSIHEHLEDSLLKLEATDPTTVAALNRIAHVLSRMGI